MFATAEDGTVLFYDTKKAEKPKGTFVFLHGGFHGNHTLLKHIYSSFIDYNLILPDLRGRGDSGFPREFNKDSLETYAKDLNIILAQERVKEIYLVGVSFGGLVSLKYASMYQVKIRALILICSSYTLGKMKRRSKILARGIDLISRPLFEMTNKWKEKKVQNVDYSDVSFPLGYGLKNLKTNSIRTLLKRYRMTVASLRFEIKKEELNRIRAKSLLIYGTKDAFFTREIQEELADILNAKLVVIPGAGHELYIQNALEVTRQIKMFLG
ncbi:MAG: alpha/beta hydrolase [Nanoarchaeota archaeon]|nr:alpha/beta hydrolase [Nanoarchaeota archaeon]